ncbi:unnamed protein product [Lymnaea stagnalis]|uniref:F-box domain-containing protein n=1 Tax=Lymnaea stagnalis TaxID=6523 RepID=A0AAV2HAG0_LYMST
MGKKRAGERTELNCEHSASKKRRVVSKLKGPSNPRSISWTKLPYLVLVEIYRNLSEIDKVAMAQVCPEWWNAFKSPVLWRTKHFIFGGPDAKNAGKRAVQYAEMLGSYLQEVSISCRHVTSNTCNVITETLEAFAKCLSNARLRHFQIEDLELDRFWKYAHLRFNIENCLVTFFQGQHNLEVVTLASAQIALLSGTEILEALLKSSGHSIRILELMDFFHGRLAAYQLSRFVLTMSGFSNLEKVTLNYCCVCNELLQHWAKSLQGKLRHLTIKAGADEPHSHTLTNETWQRLVAACPKLTVEVALFGIAHANAVIPMLSPYIPLVGFTMWSGYDDDIEWQVCL